MKKIIALLLALTSVFALFSCGGDLTGVDLFASIADGSAPTKIITQTVYNDSVNDNTLNGSFVTTVYGDDFEMECNYDYYPTVAPGIDPDKYIDTKSVAVLYHDGQYSTDGETWGTKVPSEVTKQVKFELSVDNLGEYEISADGKTLTATVTAEQAAAILGIAVSANEDGVSITVTTDGKNLREISVSYATENASLVSIVTSYSYNPVVSPFEETPETAE